jgi:hypothetical protein
MTVGEYEERFRRPASSWHQILTATQSPIQARRRRWRCLIATALLAVMTLTMEVASHHVAHTPAGKGPAGQPAFGVLPGDFGRDRPGIIRSQEYRDERDLQGVHHAADGIAARRVRSEVLPLRRMLPIKTHAGSCHTGPRVRGARGPRTGSGRCP